MKEQFATYEIAVAIKGLGFDEPCIGVWNNPNGKWIVTLVYNGILHSGYANDTESLTTSAPLWQQVIDWLWNNYKILVYPYLVPYTTKTIMWVTKYQYEDFWSTKEQAILKAIEIIKNKQS